MQQADLFLAPPAPRARPCALPPELDLPGVLERLALVCKRPRYSYMVLNLIAQASDAAGSAGPFVWQGDRRVPLRDWLADAMTPMARRDPRRRAIAEKVRRELADGGALPADPQAAEERIAEEVSERIRVSGRSNVSRAVSELVRAGLVNRHYQGYRVDHCNRGAQRQAVYTITPEARAALRPA
jgi:hypothetical protein